MDIFKAIFPDLPNLKNATLDLADSDDAEFIALLSKHYVESGMSGWSWSPMRVIRQIQNPDSLVLVGRSDDRIIAGAIVEYGALDAHLNLLAVEPLYQRNGIGTCLMKYIENSALLEGNTRVCLEVRLSNPGAREFYKALGYKEIHIKNNYYKGSESAVYMQRNLTTNPTDQTLKDQLSD
ncbi:MAG: GNAT family N-acetyltransferase [Proteobacteria bacterium]|nr:GNAT family N-acetyltransferase [Pseudomonadota bacterium]